MTNAIFHQHVDYGLQAKRSDLIEVQFDAPCAMPMILDIRAVLLPGIASSRGRQYVSNISSSRCT